MGNLEVKHSNHRNVFMSTLDQADVDVMKATKTCVAAHRFQYDYLNDDIDVFGNIDYGLTNKVPKELQDAIKDPAKKILVLINPPYAESGAGIGAGNKGGVAKTKVASSSMEKYGKASNELFTQFVARLAKEIPNATLAMFSKLKYLNAPNFHNFRNAWNAKYLGGFIVPSKSFDGIKGNFPIGFLIWRTNNASKVKMPINVIETEILDMKSNPVGAKSFYNVANSEFLTKWVTRPKPNATMAIPLKNSFSVSTSKSASATATYWSDNSIGYMLCDSNDLQHSGQTSLFSSVYKVGHDGGFYVSPANLWQAGIMFAARRLIGQTWINDRDQFLQPNCELPEAFKNDCLLWMLFHGSNLSAGADGLEWNGKTWSLVNHFIPFTETEIDAKGRFESNFMSEYLSGKKLSNEAKAVLDEGRELFRAFHAHKDIHSIREDYRLNRPDVGWYQIRNALKKRNENPDNQKVDFIPFETAYKTLSDKLRPLVYEYGFLKL